MQEQNFIVKEQLLVPHRDMLDALTTTMCHAAQSFISLTEKVIKGTWLSHSLLICTILPGTRTYAMAGVQVDPHSNTVSITIHRFASLSVSVTFL